MLGCKTFSACDVVPQFEQPVPSGCGSPIQVVADALDYFGQHFRDPIQIPSMAESLGISLHCLNFSFDRIKSVTPLQALQDHRLNKLFVALTDQPSQDLGRAIRACGLAETPGVLALFEQEFGIAMPLFLLTCRRAADDRLFRLEHPEADALVLSL
jgi:AraC-like DNA-binding protein